MSRTTQESLSCGFIMIHPSSQWGRKIYRQHMIICELIDILQTKHEYQEVTSRASANPYPRQIPVSKSPTWHPNRWISQEHHTSWARVLAYCCSMLIICWCFFCIYFPMYFPKQPGKSCHSDRWSHHDPYPLMAPCKDSSNTRRSPGSGLHTLRKRFLSSRKPR
jgi:hypothetical protein